MPVLLVRFDEDAVAGVDHLDPTATSLHETDALGHPQRLTAGVAMPRRSCSRGEVDDARADPGTGLRGRDRVDEDVAGEPVGGSAARVGLARDSHVRSPASSYVVDAAQATAAVSPPLAARG